MLAPDRLVVTLTDGAEVAFEIVKKDDLEGMVAALSSKLD